MINIAHIPLNGNNRFSHILCTVVFDLPEVFQHYHGLRKHTHQTEVQKTVGKVTVEDYLSHTQRFNIH